MTQQTAGNVAEAALQMEGRPHARKGHVASHARTLRTALLEMPSKENVCTAQQTPNMMARWDTIVHFHVESAL